MKNFLLTKFESNNAINANPRSYETLELFKTWKRNAKAAPGRLIQFQKLFQRDQFGERGKSSFSAQTMSLVFVRVISESLKTYFGGHGKYSVMVIDFR